MSWAAMASQRPAQQSAAAPQQPVVRAAPIKPAVVADVAAKQPQVGDAKPQPPRAPRPPRERRDNNRAAGAAPGAPAPAPENQDNGMAEPRQQRERVQGPPQNKYADSLQLFVGNLPHNIEEAELKEFFEKGTHWQSSH